MKPINNSFGSLDELVDLQVSVLRSGKPLRAFDEFLFLSGEQHG
jgi:hypothetical protein